MSPGRLYVRDRSRLRAGSEPSVCVAVGLIGRRFVRVARRGRSVCSEVDFPLPSASPLRSRYLLPTYPCCQSLVTASTSVLLDGNGDLHPELVRDRAPVGVDEQQRAGG